MMNAQCCDLLRERDERRLFLNEWLWASLTGSPSVIIGYLDGGPATSQSPSYNEKGQSFEWHLNFWWIRARRCSAVRGSDLSCYNAASLASLYWWRWLRLLCSPPVPKQLFSLCLQISPSNSRLSENVLLTIDQMNVYDRKIDELLFFHIAVGRLFKWALFLGRLLEHALPFDRFFYGRIGIAVKTRSKEDHPLTLIFAFVFSGSERPLVCQLRLEIQRSTY